MDEKREDELLDQLTAVEIERDDLRAQLARVTEERDDLQHTFSVMFAANMRGVEAWQAANPGNDLVWPDHAKLVEWLLTERDALAAKLRDAEAERDAARKSIGEYAQALAKERRFIRDASADRILADAILNDPEESRPTALVRVWNQLRAAEEERDALAAKLREVTEERDEYKEEVHRQGQFLHCTNNTGNGDAHGGAAVCIPCNNQLAAAVKRLAWQLGILHTINCRRGHDDACNSRQKTYGPMHEPPCDCGSDEADNIICKALADEVVKGVVG